jgi:hypothetical protein
LKRPLRQEATVPIKAAIAGLLLLAIPGMINSSYAQSSARQWAPQDGIKQGRAYRPNASDLNDRDAVDSAKSSNRRGPIDPDKEGGAQQNINSDDSAGAQHRPATRPER